MINLTSSATTLPGVGSILAKKLAKLGISTLFDLLYHLPARYEDRSAVSSVSSLQPGETITVIGQITKPKNEFTNSRKFLQKAVFIDSTGSIPVIWFNQPYLTKIIAPNSSIALHGKVEFFNSRPALVSPDYELSTMNHKPIHMARIVPVYPETAGISSKWLRSKIFHLLPQIPPEIYPGPGINWHIAMQNIHFPTHLNQILPAKTRLAFDELLLLHLNSLIHRQSWHRTKLTHPLHIDQAKTLQFIASLPFSLTPSQNRAVKQILFDLSLNRPMNRLLAGDVGSGKTVVAAVAAYCAYLNGRQTLFLAPTQILARQHHSTLSALFKPLSMEVGLVTATTKFQISNLKSQIVVGTHALLNRSFPNVGLVVIDEQHRFGVVQRAQAAAQGQSPHVLTMTATPIPRTIALTLYGDLDLSLLDNIPGRLPVKTWVIPEAKRASAYTWIKSQISNLPAGRQVFIVCPFIDESETLKSVKAATAEFDRLKSIFPGFKLGLLHGKLKAKDKEEVISKFQAGALDILVTTPVVEVGIDIPQAQIMVIETAERFGLAQLHQLRGRVGRSQRQAYCLLFSPTATARLKALETHHSGLDLAEIDLKLRGPGQIYGTAQSGLSQLKIASYQDLGLVSQAKALAEKLFPQLDRYPILNSLLSTDKIGLIQPN